MDNPVVLQACSMVWNGVCLCADIVHSPFHVSELDTSALVNQTVSSSTEHPKRVEISTSFFTVGVLFPDSY